VRNQAGSKGNGQARPARELATGDDNRAPAVSGPEFVHVGLAGRLTATGYAPPEDLCFEGWQADGEILQQMEWSVSFWLGDWWNFGERKWGELSAQAIREITGRERGTVWNYAYVARSVDASRRREELSFSHHYEVAKVARDDADLADELLDRAVEQKLTREELRDAVKRVTRERALAQLAPGDDRLPSDVTVADARRLPLDDAVVDLIVTSPPYALDVAYPEGDIQPDAWPSFMHDWLVEARRVTREGGRLALNVPLDTTKGGFRPTYAQAIEAALAAGWTYRFTVVWVEENVSKSTARGSVDSPQAVHVVAPVEMIAVFCKGAWKRDQRGRTWDLDRQDWLELTSGLWRFPGESNAWEGFDGAFPIELPSRLIKLLSFRDDLVCDPFLGSATTAVAALRLGRRFVGFDISQVQIDSAKRRLATAFSFTSR
jgi:site-specific DNA-methyltransferase (adenine-specific)